MHRGAAGSGESVRCEDLADRKCGRRGRVDDAYVAAGHPLDLPAEQGIVGAAEEDRVDDRPDHAALGEQWSDVLAHGR